MNRTNAFRGTAVVVAAVVGLLHYAPAAADVVASEGWVVATEPGAKAGSGYLVLTNNGTEEAKLLSITSSVSDKVMIHRSSMDSQGVARLWPVAKLEIAPGQSVRFDPRGLSVTFNELKTPFVVGQKISLQLVFEDQPAFTTMLEVKPLGSADRADKMSAKTSAHRNPHQ